MYRVEFYRWSSLKDAYELVRSYWTDKREADNIIDLYRDNPPGDHNVYRYNVYGVVGLPGFLVYSIHNDLFPLYDKDALK